MSNQRLAIPEFLQYAHQQLVIDVRSPAEYQHAHMPGAVNIPLFDNEERKIVGTIYKQKSREDAIKIGLDLFGPKMRRIVEEVESLLQNKTTEENDAEKQEQIDRKSVAIYCWRGGMRSGAVAWLLSLYGYKIYLLDGGYKAFRNWVLGQFEKEYSLKVLGGFTGSGKTEILKELKEKGQNVIDLEKLAHHKGSAFGRLGEEAQPTSEMFENTLAIEL